MNFNDPMQSHIDLLSKQVGHNVGNKYSLIISDNDFINAYTKMRDELNYPLMIDSKYRRAIVYNKKGLEKKVYQSLFNSIINNIKLFDKVIVEDIVSQLNGLVSDKDGKFKVSSNKSVNKNTVNMLLNAMVKGLVQGIGHIIDDITNPKERR